MERRSETEAEKMLERVRKASAQGKCSSRAAALGVMIKRRGWIKAATWNCGSSSPCQVGIVRRRAFRGERREDGENGPISTSGREAGQ